MTMTYERYKELVPKETLEFTNMVLACLSSGINQRSIPTNISNRLSLGEAECLIALLHSYANIEQYKEFMESQLFINRNFFKQPQSNINYSRLFALHSSLFLISDYDEEYINLSPTKILLNEAKLFKEHSYEFLDSMRKLLFEAPTSLSSFIIDLNKCYNLEEYDDMNKKSDEVYAGLSKNVRSYLETASIIMKSLVSNYYDNEMISSIPNDFVPIALLLAAAHYEDVEADEYGLVKKSTILDLLEEKGIVLRPGIKSTLLNYDMEASNPDIRTVLYYFKKYYKEGIYALGERNVTVSGIIENVLRDDGLNDTPILRRIIPLQYQDTFAGFEANVDFEFKKMKRDKELEYTTPLLGDISYETKKFLVMTTKIYTMIKRKMESDTHNKEVLLCDDDADTLSLFLTPFFMELDDVDVVTFYKRHGVTLNKILDFLKISITQEEIEDTPLNKKVLIDKFNRFVVDGVNNDCQLTSISPNNICNNLCDRKFNKSAIMEGIYNSLSDDHTVGPNFLEQVKSEIQEAIKKEEDARMAVEKKEKEEMTNELFDGMDDETIRFLWRLSIICQDTISRVNSINRATSLSILLALCNTGPEDMVWEALKENGFSVNCFIYNRSYQITDALYISANREAMPYEFDVKVLYDHYKDFIFDKATGKKRNILEMVRQIPSFCDESVLKELYNSRNINEGVFLNIENEVESLKEEKENEALDSKVKHLFSPNHEVSNVFDNAIRILEYLKAIHFDKTPEADLPDLSILLSILSLDDCVSLPFKERLEANEITLLNVCRLLRLDIRELQSFKTKIKHYTHVDDYKKYFEGLENATKYDTSIFVKKFFYNNHALDTIISKINEESTSHQIDRHRIEVEAISNRPFLEALSVQEKRELLASFEVEPLDHNNWRSLLTYGSSLLEHLDSICDEFERLEGKENSEDEINYVYKSLARVCHVDVSSSKESKVIFAAKINRAVSSRITFAKSLHIRSSKMSIRQSELPRLCDQIESAINTLSKEIDEYYKLFEYVEVFRRKNSEYCSNAQAKEVILASKNDEYSPSDKLFARGQMEATRIGSLSSTIEKLQCVDELTKTYITSICNAITRKKNYIASLSMAQNVLIPLLRRYISKPNIQNDDLLLSNSIVRLLNGVLARNEDYIEGSMKLLDHSILPRNDFEAIKDQLPNNNEFGIDGLVGFGTQSSSGMFGLRSDGTLAEIMPTSPSSEKGDKDVPKLILNGNK